MELVSIDRTKKEFDRVVNQVGERMLAFPWKDTERYGMWLAQTYFYVRHTTHLICLAALGFGPEQRDQHYHALEHLTDENGHDLMAKNDYLNLMQKNSLELDAELVETALFYQNQYFVIEKWGSTAHLGYSLLLEGVAATFGPEINQMVQKHHPPKSCQFIQVHAELDQNHYREGLKSFGLLSPSEQSKALLNLKQSAFLYTNILDSIEQGRYHFLQRAG